MSSEDKPRLPRSDIPADYRCPYPDCTFAPKPDSKRQELSFRNHMAQVHGVYYETAPVTDVSTKLAKYGRHLKDFEQLEALAPWHCVALARHVVYGQSFAAVAKEMPGRHSPEKIAAISRSPAGIAFMEKMSKELTDPVKVVKDLMKSDSLEMHMMWLQARDWAYQAKDYEAIHKMAKDIGLTPVIEDNSKSAPANLTLHLSVADLAMPEVKTSFKVVEKADYEIVDEDDDT